MGIKHFWRWYKDNFKPHIKRLGKKQTFDDVKVEIDNLMIDLNGLFHNSTQKVFKYGNHKVPASLLRGKRQKKVGGLQKQLDVFSDVCKEIENLLNIVGPQKKLILCIDGPAPLSKQNQQRQRRFRSASEKGR